MEPWTRLRTRLDGLTSSAPPPPTGGRIGAALALLADEADGEVSLILTRRRDDLSTHPGQISFPGGKVDPGEGIEAAALREAHEECGLDVMTATVLGELPAFYIPPSRFWLQVVVARWDAPHPLVPAEAEVAEILSVRFSTLAEAARWRTVRLSAGGRSWAWRLDDGQILWGATAIVTAVLLDAATPGWSGGQQPDDLPDDREVRPWEHLPSSAPRRPARLPDVPERPAAAAQAAPPVDLETDARPGSGGVDDAADGDSALARAGAITADAVLELLGGPSGPVLVLAGTGRTGGIGLVAAAALVVAGVEVAVRLPGDRLTTEATGVRAAALVDLGDRVQRFDGSLPPAALVLDALAGAGLDGALRPPLLPLVLALRQIAAPVVSVDLPTGLHPVRGVVGDAVSADVTLAVGAPAPGLFASGLAPFVGDLYLLDTGTGEGTDPLVRLLPAGVDEGWRE